jgi:hypothetical protein
MRIFVFVFFFVCVLLNACTIGAVVTNAPSSLGNCMPEKPAGGCP